MRSWISFKFSCGRETIRQLPSTFSAAGMPSFNFCKVSMRPEDLLLTFRATGWTFINLCQLSVRPEDLPSTFYVAGRPSVNFWYHYLQTGDILSTFSSFCATNWPSVKFPPLSMLGDLPLTSVNFPCCRDCVNFCHNYHATEKLPVNFHQLSMWPGYLPSTFVNFPCDQETFYKIPSTMCAAGRPCVKFCQFSIRPGDLQFPSTF